MFPSFLINTSFVARNTLPPFTFRQLISHRRSHDISLSFPRISRAQLTRLRLIVQARATPREIFDRHQSGSNRIFLLVKSSSSMHYNFNEIHL